MTEEKKKIVSQEDMMKLLDSLYQRVLDGVPKVSPSVEEMAQDYLKKNLAKDRAIRAMTKNQIAKCATSGFIAGFGGLLALPVVIPANISSVLYVQMRMIACIAYIAGYDLKSDQTQTFVYACLAGVTLNGILKNFGVQFGVKFATELVKKIPGQVLTKINQRVGFRLVTKFGTKGLINLGKVVPGVGALISGGMDYAETKVIAKRAYQWFMEGDFSGETEETSAQAEEEPIIDVTDYEKVEEIKEEQTIL